MKGDKLTKDGVIISVKSKTDRTGQPFIGVTVKPTRGGPLLWFRTTEEEIERLETEDGLRIVPNFPLGLAGYESGRAQEPGTVDDSIIFLEHETVFSPAADTEEIAAYLAEHFSSMDFLREYNANALQTLRSETDERSTIPAAGELPQGTFTVLFESGDYRTLKVKPVLQRCPNPEFNGWQFVAFLCGPENTADYKNFAYRKAGEEILRLKNGYRDDSQLVTALRALITADPAKRHEMGVRWAQGSGNCYACGRKLTTPESIEAGIGPVCDRR